jgi:hypothetical protein
MRSKREPMFVRLNVTKRSNFLLTTRRHLCLTPRATCCCSPIQGRRPMNCFARSRTMIDRNQRSGVHFGPDPPSATIKEARARLQTSASGSQVGT